jgi:alpha-tubulin suppressor-like RCC1 family protein
VSKSRRPLLLIAAPIALAGACTGLRSGTDALPLPDGGVPDGGDATAPIDARAGDAVEASPGADADAGTDAQDAAGPPTAVALSSWNLRVCALLSSGRVTCWGNDGTSNQVHAPTPVNVVDGGLLDGVSQIAVGFMHACALQSGSILCWGDQSWGETGISESGSVQILPNPGLAVQGTYTSVAARGWNGASFEPWGGFSCGIDPQNAVWCWGSNDDDALGHAQGASGDVSFYDDAASRQVVLNPTPVAVAGLSDAQQIALYNGGGCAVTWSGAVQCWGWNGHGELANGSFANSPTPVPAMIAPGQPLTNVKRIYGGHDALCALQADGTLWCWGRDDAYPFGLGPDAGAIATPPTIYAGGTLGAIADVAIGQRHMCVIRAADSSVWCSGYNAEYELGANYEVGCPPCVTAPVQVLGPGGTGHLTGALELSATWASTCARTPGGVYCWGYNAYGATGHAPGVSPDVASAIGPCTPFPAQVPGL